MTTEATLYCTLMAGKLPCSVEAYEELEENAVTSVMLAEVARAMSLQDTDLSLQEAYILAATTSRLGSIAQISTLSTR